MRLSVAVADADTNIIPSIRRCLCVSMSCCLLRGETREIPQKFVPPNVAILPAPAVNAKSRQSVRIALLQQEGSNTRTALSSYNQHHMRLLQLSKCSSSSVDLDSRNVCSQ